MRLHPAGRTPVLGCLGASLALAVLCRLLPEVLVWPCIVLSGLCLLGACFLLYFYRDPSRSAEGDGLLAAADGCVVQIRQVEDCSEIGGPATVLSVFMSPLNVHVNRACIEGEVLRTEYRPGKYLVAFHDKASELNEANLLVLQDEQGRRLALRQIAGAVARRILCPVEAGDRLQRGERYGMIQFGSRVDHFLPPEVRLCVREHDKVKAGQTVIGVWS